MKTKKAFRRYRRLAMETRPILATRFPQAFAGWGEEKKPLKIGIDADLFEACAGMSRSSIKAALRDYTTGVRYLRNMQEGAARIDLAGQPSGAVTVEEATIAAARLVKVSAAISSVGGRARAKTEIENEHAV